MKLIWFEEAWEDDNVNRLVYRVRENQIEIISCKGHYEE